MRIDNPTGSIASLTGSFTGSFYGDGLGLINIESASYAETASYAASASYAISSSHEIVTEVSSSYAETATSSSYALTASYALNGGSGGGGGSADYSPYQTGSSDSVILPKEGNNCCVMSSFSTIAGGRLNRIVQGDSFIGGGNCNTIATFKGVIGGGECNITAGSCSTIGGGSSNCAQQRAFVGGGNNNSANNLGAAVVGGSHNTGSSPCSFVGGGECNVAYGYYTSVVGGINNTMCASGGTTTGRSAILGGENNCITHHCSFIIGANLTSDKDCYTFMNNADVAGTVSASIFSGSFVGDGSGLTGISGGGGGSDYSPYQTGSVSSGILPKEGSNCDVIGSNSTIAGGIENEIGDNTSTISFIGGGCQNLIGSTQNTAGFIGGGINNTLHSYTGNGGTIVGGENNLLCIATAGFIGGGSNNTIKQSIRSVIVGGSNNIMPSGATTNYISIVGGFQNTGSCDFAGILGGCQNHVNNDHSFIIGSSLTSDKDCYTFMNNADVAGTVSASMFSGSFVGDGSGLTGVSGGGGGTIYNSTVRYVAYNSTQLVEILSTGTMYSGLSWSRSGATITITSTAHGLSNGDYVVVRNMGDTDYVYGAISSVTTDSFQITNAVSSGDTSGTAGAYIPAADATSVTDDGATIGSPTVGDIQIISIKVHFNTLKSGNTFDLTMPTSLTNGAGGNTSNATMNPPIVGVWNLSTGAFNASGLVSIWGGTGSAGSYNVFQVGGINQLVDGMVKFTF